MLDRLMGIPELAAFVGVPEGTVRRWLYVGTAPRSIRVGRYIKFRPEDVEQWLEANRRDGRS